MCGHEPLSLLHVLRAVQGPWFAGTRACHRRRACTVVAALIYVCAGAPLMCGCSTGGRALRLHTLAVTAVAFSPNSSMLATGGRDGRVALWTLPEGRLFRQVLPNGGSLRHSRNGLILERPDGSITHWTPQMRPPDIKCLSFVSETHVVSLGGSAIIWDVASGLESVRVDFDVTPRAWAMPTTVRPYLTVCGSTGRVNRDVVEVWSMRDRARQVLRLEEPQYIPCLSMNAAGSLLALGSGMTVRVYAIPEGTCMSELKCSARVRACEFGNNDRIAVAVDDGGSIYTAVCGKWEWARWDVEARNSKGARPGSQYFPMLLASPNSCSIIVAFGDVIVALQGDNIAQRVSRWTAAGAVIPRMLCVGGENLLTTGGRGDAIQVWKTATERLVQTVGQCPEGVATLAVSSNGRYVAAVGGGAAERPIARLFRVFDEDICVP